MILYRLTLAHAADVNLVVGCAHVYSPAAKAGQQLAYGQLDLVLMVQQAYFGAGYGTRVDAQRVS